MRDVSDGRHPVLGGRLHETIRHGLLVRLCHRQDHVAPIVKLYLFHIFRVQTPKFSHAEVLHIFEAKTGPVAFRLLPEPIDRDVTQFVEAVRRLCVFFGVPVEKVQVRVQPHDEHVAVFIADRDFPGIVAKTTDRRGHTLHRRT